MKTIKKTQIKQLIKKESRATLLKGFFLGVVLMAGTRILSASAFTIDTSFENAVQYIKSIFVTANGKPSGSVVVAMNTGGNALLVNGTASFGGNVNISGSLNAVLNELDPKVGSGTIGKLCTYNSGNKIECLTTIADMSPWKVSGTTTYFTGDKVGIGTNNPQATLDINQPWFNGNLIRVGTNTHTNFSVHAGGDAYIGGRLAIGGTYSTNGEGLHVEGNTHLLGNVGINTASPTTDFDVVGNAKISEGLGVDGNSYFNDYLGIGTTSPTTALDVNGEVTISQGNGGNYLNMMPTNGDAPRTIRNSYGSTGLGLAFYRNTGHIMTITSSGGLSINGRGTTDTYKLSVNGGAKINGGLKVKKEDGTSIMTEICTIDREGEIRYFVGSGASGLIICNGAGARNLLAF